MLYSTTQVAKELGITRITLRKLIDNGRLRAVNVATTDSRPIWRISRDSLDEFLRKNEKEPTA